LFLSRKPGVACAKPICGPASQKAYAQKTSVGVVGCRKFGRARSHYDGRTNHNLIGRLSPSGKPVAMLEKTHIGKAGCPNHREISPLSLCGPLFKPETTATIELLG